MAQTLTTSLAPNHHKMNIKNLINCVLISCCIACNNNSKTGHRIPIQVKFQERNVATTQDHQIINATLIPLLFPLRDMDANDLNRKVLPESLRDTLYFTPYLLPVSSEKQDFRMSMDTENEHWESLAKDTTYAFSRQLFSKDLKLLKIIPQRISNTGVYRLLKLEPSKLPERKPGEKLITYSCIVYNPAKDRACFYFENNCYGSCGFAELVFVKKENGIWKVDKNIFFWIS